jgi:triacylglycerol esterase/lipase EstA (alpha/beta hydrolase family)
VPAIWQMLSAFGVAMALYNAALYVVRAHVLRGLEACDAVDRLGVVKAAWAFATECAATAAVLLAIPLGWLLPHCRSAGGTHGPVLLIHGWSLNRGCFWLLRRRLLRDGWSPVCCLDYRSLRLDVEGGAARLRAAVDRLAHTRGAHQPVTLIGHSLGGLVARYYARRYPAPTVRRIVTLGTPHGGTALARMRGGAGRKLAPGSPFLNTLNTADRVPHQFDVIAIHSSFDAMILPPQNAEYPVAFNIRVDDVGHNALLFSAKVYALIRENLGAPFLR